MEQQMSRNVFGTLEWILNAPRSRETQQEREARWAFLAREKAFDESIAHLPATESLAAQDAHLCELIAQRTVEAPVLHAAGMSVRMIAATFDITESGARELLGHSATKRSAATIRYTKKGNRVNAQEFVAGSI
jgi:hypothetical protein